MGSEMCIRDRYGLGVMYDNGRGAVQDYSAAMKWYRMAADQGHAKAQCNLGIMYKNGHGVPQNTSQALRWLYKAQVQGEEEAKQGIELIMQAMRETRASQQANNSSMPPPSASPVPKFDLVNRTVCFKVFTDGRIWCSQSIFIAIFPILVLSVCLVVGHILTNKG